MENDTDNLVLEKLVDVLLAQEKITSDMADLIARPTPKMTEQKALAFDYQELARAIAPALAIEAKNGAASGVSQGFSAHAYTLSESRGYSLKILAAVGGALLVLGVALTLAILSPAVLPSDALCAVISFEASPQSTANGKIYDSCYYVID